MELVKKIVTWARIKSPWILHFNTGACNACDIEIIAALTPRYDLERFGVQLKGTPRHADVLVCSGPVCRGLVREAAAGDVLQPNTAYIAPGGKQMRIASGPANSKVIQITDDPPENNCRPAVDYLFRSVAAHFPGQAMAVILTGMGNDGTLGLRLLKRHGCFVIAQDEASCVVYGMPKAAVEAGVTDVSLPLESIAARVAATVRGGKA